eukprot:m.90142 g.90142  ORF g.90142 m.90142 type:complete len:56 (-) comp26367_c0_seq1:363-530(-)
MAAMPTNANKETSALLKDVDLEKQPIIGVDKELYRNATCPGFKEVNWDCIVAEVK